MKLLHVVTLRLSLLATVVLALWSVFFYMAVVKEVDDETDDQLEIYAEQILRRALAGEELPTGSSGSNNQYFLRDVSHEYASVHEHVRYEDREVFIKERNETEPARVLTYIYRKDNGEYMELEVSTPTIEKSELREAIALWLVFLFCGLMLAMALLHFWIIGRNMRPLHRLLAWLESYTPGVKPLPLNNATTVDEFRKLNEVTVEAVTRSEQLHEQQKQFIGNASHEMQTPLAVCTGRLEMLLDDESLTEQQMGELLKVHNTLETLAKMNRSLLLLSKIDGGQFPDKKKVNFNLLLAQFLPDYEMVYAQKHIHIVVDEKGDFVLDMDESLATTLLTNLLKNAFVHSPAGQQIHIVADSHRLRIANAAMGEALNEELIFTRFYHTAGQRHSTGLGLPIVRAISKLYGFHVGYEYADGQHIFTVEKARKCK